MEASNWRTRLQRRRHIKSLSIKASFSFSQHIFLTIHQKKTTVWPSWIYLGGRFTWWNTIVVKRIYWYSFPVAPDLCQSICMPVCAGMMCYIWRYFRLLIVAKVGMVPESMVSLVFLRSFIWNPQSMTLETAPKILLLWSFFSQQSLPDFTLSCLPLSSGFTLSIVC